MFSRLNRRQKAKTLNQPGLVVESAEVFEGCDQFRDRLEVADPEQLLLERFEEAFIQPLPSGSRTKAGDDSMPRKRISFWKSSLMNWEP